MSFPDKPGSFSKNSVFVNTGVKVISNIPILPVRDTIKSQTGPAFDIVDEALYHFRTNIFMRDFPVKTEADRLLIYLTFYAMKCLRLFGQKGMTKAKAALEIEAWNLKPFPVPGDGGFIIDSYVTAPANDQEKNELRNFFKSIRVEIGHRLLEVVFKTGEADKWWVCFSQRKFLNKDMAN